MTDALPTPAARILAHYLSNLSEEYWCAGWLIDWEYMAWDEMHGDGKFLTAEEQGNLAWLHDLAGGWIVWDDGETFVPTAEWILHLEDRAEFHRDPGDESDYLTAAYQTHPMDERTVSCSHCGDVVPPGYAHEDCGRADGPVVVPERLPDLTDLEV